MSDYAAQFQRSYNYPPAARYPTNRMQSPPHYAHNTGGDMYTPQHQQLQQYGHYPYRFDYANVPVLRPLPQQLQQPDDPNFGYSHRGVVSEIHRQWNYGRSGPGMMHFLF